MGIFKKSENSWLCQFTASEVKIFLIFCYLLTVLAVLWTTLTYDISKHDETAIKIGTYIRCLAGGIHDKLDCKPYRKEFEDITIQELQVLYLILVAFLNFSNLPLIIEYKSMKAMIVSTLVSTLGSTLGTRDTVKESEMPSHSVKESEAPLHINN